jgi:hypothetical protein
MNNKIVPGSCVKIERTPIRPGIIKRRPNRDTAPEAGLVVAVPDHRCLVVAGFRLLEIEARWLTPLW